MVMSGGYLKSQINYYLRGSDDDPCYHPPLIFNRDTNRSIIARRRFGLSCHDETKIQ